MGVVKVQLQETVLKIKKILCLNKVFIKLHNNYFIFINHFEQKNYNKVYVSHFSN